MNKYGYVSNNYGGMAGQSRAMTGMMSGGCSGYTGHHHHHQTHMAATQSPCSCKHGAGARNKPIIMTQPGRSHGFSAGQMMEREWTTGLCGCFEHCASCMAAFCCLPCHEMYLSNRMGENMCGPLCGKQFMVALRTRLRSVNGIEGSVCGDLFTYMFCPCCTIAQMHREIKNTTEI